MQQGGCLCGEVRYRIEGEPISSGICHCRTCRKTASAPTLPFVTVAAERFVITRGEPAEYRSSPQVRRAFCGRCGSPLTYRNEQEPGRLDVMSCSLDEPEAVPPRFHLWVSHDLGWVATEQDLPRFATTRSAG